MLTDTEQTTVVGSTVTQTTFHFDRRKHLDLADVNLYIEQGGHKPSPEESLLAPFFPDPSQRILVIELRQWGAVFVMKTEVLLRLAQEWGGGALEWEQWKGHGIGVRPRDVADIWVSGPRLFCVSAAEETWMDVYDFSPQASSRHLGTTTHRGGVPRRFMRPSIQIHRLPWDALHLVSRFANGGHDSIVLLIVNTPHFSNLTRV